MDLVSDLTSQCVTYITVAKEVYKQQLVSGANNLTPLSGTVGELANGFTVNTNKLSLNLKVRVWELIFISKEHKYIFNKERPKKHFGPNLDMDSIALVQENTLKVFFNTCYQLISWVYKNKENAESLPDLYSTAYEWRSCVRSILYKNSSERLKLVEILEYMPVQVIFCLGASQTPENSDLLRLYQVWDPKVNLHSISEADKKKLNDWWNTDRPDYNLDKKIVDAKLSRRDIARKLLIHDALLLEWLTNEETPLPFENIFIAELQEIENSRIERNKTGAYFEFNQDKIIIGNSIVDDSKLTGFEHSLESEVKSKPEINDPYQRAKEMKLYGLAFSGGGIRSATFNLGILQKFAEYGVLSKFDILSTVSGGGYIGSWFVSWIKRSGSVAKVQDRLNPKKSADPMSDEVRPIRWLRMFSNYLAPNSSIMSDDSWTMGVTWLRNTLINQFLLLTLLCSCLALIFGIFGVWEEQLKQPVSVDQSVVMAGSGIILLIGAVLAGWGMHAFGPEHPPRSFGLEKSDKLYTFLMLWGILSTFVVSGWLYSHTFYHIDFGNKFKELGYSAVIGFVSFLVVAWLGRYDKSIEVNNRTEVILYVIISSLLAAIAGCFCLCLSWQMLENISAMHFYKIRGVNNKLAFVIGVPLILESISITVMVRMAIMGILFPDLRREWWGRMGAKIHRFIFVWLLVASSALLLPDYLYSFPFKRINVPALFATWSAIIGYAVKLAYGSKAPNQQSDKGGLSVSELFVRFAPYLFALGFLILGALALRYIEPLFNHFSPTKLTTWQHLYIGGILALVTFCISYRVGVNEFSLHHFYRNRLVRAYLGATRRREVREKSANNFTNFDQDDDFLLTSLTTDENYFGPFPIINTALNSSVVTDLDRQDRKAESFVFTPKYCGFDVSRTRPVSGSGVYEYGFRPTKPFAYPEGPFLGTAMTISGAAVSPNMGFHSSPGTAFLLTLFNVRLGWWIGNPRTDLWKTADPWAGIFYLIKDLIGRSDIKSDYVYLSDGGHFDNMGIYELIRRRCSYIVLCDGEEDEKSICEGLANAIRRCRVDFGTVINIALEPITNKDPKTGYCAKHFVKGDIWYPGDVTKPSGTLVYIKTSLTGNESVDIREYFLENPAFPQQSTSDQFFDEAQFESYRQLGYESI